MVEIQEGKIFVQPLRKPLQTHAKSHIARLRLGRAPSPYVFKGEFYLSGCTNGIKAVHSFGMPLVPELWDCYPQKDGSSKSPALMDVGSTRRIIVMNSSESHIARLRLGRWVYNYWTPSLINCL